MNDMEVLQTFEMQTQLCQEKAAALRALLGEPEPAALEGQVRCNQAFFCRDPLCGAKSPHYYTENECGHCPKNDKARCVSVIPADGKARIKGNGPSEQYHTTYCPFSFLPCYDTTACNRCDYFTEAASEWARNSGTFTEHK